MAIKATRKKMNKERDIEKQDRKEFGIMCNHKKMIEEKKKKRVYKNVGICIPTPPHPNNSVFTILFFPCVYR